MRKTVITEFRGQWVVSVEQHAGPRQDSICETLALARRWARLFGAPLKVQANSALKAQPEA